MLIMNQQEQPGLDGSSRMSATDADMSLEYLQIQRQNNQT